LDDRVHTRTTVKSPRPPGVNQGANAWVYADALLAFEVPSFAEVICAVRQRRGQPLPEIAGAALLSAVYYTQLENCGRLAPPRKTALRIARALGMNDLETTHLAWLAEAERATAVRDAHLPIKVRQLLATIRASAPHIPADLLDTLQARLRERM
jgi:transcriptional regulator with XRE-family HTH domain